MKTSVSALALLTLAVSVRAQTPSQPSLVLSIIAGVSASNGLWDVERQPLCLPDPSCAPTDPHDTLRLTRDVTPSIVAGVMATLYRGPHLGLSLEILYIGLPLDDTCTGVKFNPDLGADPIYGPRNQQLCLNITAASLSTSVIAAMGGFVLRAAPRGSFSPYVRAGFGVMSYSTSTIDVSGAFVQAGQEESRAVVVDKHPKSVGVAGQVSAGFTERLGPGYQLRFEVQDALIPLQTLSGPADDLGNAPTSTHLFHRIALRLGLDVVLEQKRGRRY